MSDDSACIIIYGYVLANKQHLFLRNRELIIWVDMSLLWPWEFSASSFSFSLWYFTSSTSFDFGHGTSAPWS